MAPRREPTNGSGNQTDEDGFESILIESCTSNIVVKELELGFPDLPESEGKERKVRVAQVGVTKVVKVHRKRIKPEPIDPAIKAREEQVASIQAQHEEESKKQEHYETMEVFFHTKEVPYDPEIMCLMFDGNHGLYDSTREETRRRRALEKLRPKRLKLVCDIINSKLTARQREVIDMVFLQDNPLTRKETAILLHVAPSAITQFIQRGVLRIQKELRRVGVKL